MKKKNTAIHSVRSFDARYALPAGAGSDAVHSESEYCLAVTLLEAKPGLTGSGIVLTLGEGNRIVCELIDLLATELVGKEIEDLMADFGAFSRGLADHPQLRPFQDHLVDEQLPVPHLLLVVIDGHRGNVGEVGLVGIIAPRQTELGQDNAAE